MMNRCEVMTPRRSMICPRRTHPVVAMELYDLSLLSDDD